MFQKVCEILLFLSKNLDQIPSITDHLELPELHLSANCHVQEDSLLGGTEDDMGGYSRKFTLQN